MKKIVIFGGGSGLSQLLKGIKLFPLEITAVVSVADNGGSTGRLRKELNIPAVGDITKVMVAMSDTDQDMVDLLNYRFTKSKTLGNHSVKNLLLNALIDLQGSFDKAIPVLAKMLDLKGTILPLTEDNVDLIGITKDGKKVYGEEMVTKSASQIKRLEYNKKINVNPKVMKAVRDADLIIFSSGSLLTSIIPHLLDENLVAEINKAKAKKMYICNLFTQPGETDKFSVADHLDLLETYLGKDSIDVVIANNTVMNSTLVAKYSTQEQKDPVLLDMNELENRKVQIIADRLFKIEENYYRHDSLKTAYLIFAYLMGDKRA
ncbi:MAG: YvcK family protein [Bacilli bacterium]|nr:YvcK family protein [Bacilli bacterium]